MPPADAGERTDWLLSVPVPSGAKSAASAAPLPALDSPGVRVRSHGFDVRPPSEESRAAVTISVRLVLPRMIAPAARRRSTTNASCAGWTSFSAIDAPVVGRSDVLYASFSTTGMPCSGLRRPFVRRSSSSARAVASAFGFMLMNALMFGPVFS